MAQQSSPLLDDYNNTGIVTPALQRALDITRRKLPQFQLQPEAQPAAVPRFTTPGPQLPLITRGTPDTSTTMAPTAPTTVPPMVTDPDAGAHLTERDRLIKTGSGISQIHNPVGRGLLRAADVIGSAFAPRITAGIPGTELHHNYLVKQAESSVDKDVTRAKEKATTAETEQRAANEALAAPGARAHTEAETQELNARTKSLTNADKAEAKTIETDQGIMQWNPDTKRYDIPVGAAPGKQQENTHVLPDGTVIAVHNDPKTGKSTAEVLYQGKPAEKPGHVIQRTINGKIHNILIDAETGADRQDLGEGRQPNVPDRGVTGFAGGKVVRLEPGQEQPKDFTTTTQAGSLNVPTVQQRNVAGQAQLVHDQTPYMLSEIERLKGKLGPMQGRLNELMQGKIGMEDADFAGLGADLLMYSSAVALMHARGRLPENLRAEFQKAIDNPGQSFQNLKAVITKIDGWTVKNPGVKPGNGGESNVPGGISLEDINAEIERRKKK